MGGRSVTFTFTFSRAFPTRRVVDEHVRINCTPVINLFAQEAPPLRIDRSRSEYRIVPYKQRKQRSMRSRAWTGHVQGRSDRIVYEPFEAFRHEAHERPRRGRSNRERLQPSVVGRGVDHFLSFVTPRVRSATWGPSHLHRAHLYQWSAGERSPIGALDQPTSETPATVASPIFSPSHPAHSTPIGESLLWRLISNLARNFGSLTTWIATEFDRELRFPRRARCPGTTPARSAARGHRVLRARRGGLDAARPAGPAAIAAAGASGKARSAARPRCICSDPCWSSSRRLCRAEQPAPLHYPGNRRQDRVQMEASPEHVDLAL